MALHYFLDGYNVIKCVDALADYSLEEGRAALLRILNVQRPQGSMRNTVTVVFDGRADMFGFRDGGLARVVFTSGESADEYIKRTVMREPNKASVVVVSNDREIVCYIRKLGARDMDVETFMAVCFPADNGPARRRVPDGGKGLSRCDEQRINTELERIWLEEQQG